MFDDTIRKVGPEAFRCRRLLIDATFSNLLVKCRVPGFVLGPALLPSWAQDFLTRFDLDPVALFFIQRCRKVTAVVLKAHQLVEDQTNAVLAANFI